MKKISALILALGLSIMMYAQDSTLITNPQDSALSVPVQPPVTPSPKLNTPAPAAAPKKNKWSNLNLANRPKDHFVVQLSHDSWSRIPDTISTKGLSRGVNVYFMFDFPFKSNPQYSVAVGAGVSNSNIYFDKTDIDIVGRYANKLSFRDVADTTHFKKYKLMTTFLEAPVEFRYTKDPAHPKKSFKAAAGIKIGTMLSAITKGKTLQSSTGQTVLAYTQKEKSKRFFNSTRLSVTGRVGFGALSLFGSYQVNAFVKEGFGPDVRPFSIGISLSGL